MAPKRKHSATLVESTRTTRSSKRRKTASSLTDLPTEILDTILNYALIDPTDFRWAADRRGAVKIFTQSLMQTSRTVRKMCLDHVNRRCLWVKVILEKSLIDPFHDGLERLPLLPDAFCYFIPASAAFVCFSPEEPPNSSPSTRKSRADKKRTFVFPFNFVSLIGLCSTISERGLEDSICRLTINQCGTDGSFEFMMSTLVMPALLTLYDLTELVMETEGQNTYPGRNLDSTHSKEEDWSFEKLYERARDIVEAVEALRQGGHCDEARVLLLASGWVSIEAESHLPRPDEWALGEVDRAASNHWVSARCPEGNRLRSMLHKVEHQACLAYVHLCVKYGKEWGRILDPFIDDIEVRFMAEPEFTWFGASPQELADLHYGRALLQEEFARQFMEDYEKEHGLKVGAKIRTKKRKNQPLPGEYKTNIELAILQMFMTRMLRTKDDYYREYRHRLMRQLGQRDAKSLDNYCHREFVTIRDPNKQSDYFYNQHIIWAGDRDTLKEWGGEDVLQYYPLAQKGLDVDQTWSERSRLWDNQ